MPAKVALVKPYRSADGKLYARGQIGMDIAHSTGKISVFKPYRDSMWRLMFRTKSVDGKTLLGYPYRSSDGKLMIASMHTTSEIPSDSCKAWLSTYGLPATIDVSLDCQGQPEFWFTLINDGATDTSIKWYDYLGCAWHEPYISQWENTPRPYPIETTTNPLNQQILVHPEYYPMIWESSRARLRLFRIYRVMLSKTDVRYTDYFEAHFIEEVLHVTGGYWYYERMCYLDTRMFTSPHWATIEISTPWYPIPGYQYVDVYIKVERP